MEDELYQAREDGPDLSSRSIDWDFAQDLLKWSDHLETGALTFESFCVREAEART